MKIAKINAPIGNFNKNLILRFQNLSKFSPFYVKIFITKYTKIRKFFSREKYPSLEKNFIFLSSRIIFCSNDVRITVVFWYTASSRRVECGSYAAQMRRLCTQSGIQSVPLSGRSRRRIHSDSWHALNRFDGNEKTHRGGFSPHWRRHRLDYLSVVNSVIAKFCEKIPEISAQRATWPCLSPNSTP